MEGPRLCPCGKVCNIGNALVCCNAHCHCVASFEPDLSVSADFRLCVCRAAAHVFLSASNMLTCSIFLVNHGHLKGVYTMWSKAPARIVMAVVLV